ncbi:sensor histidine kinase [Kribbella sp. CA-294648]|uniref:sensor histidine kinase n=1 Tax=Kribbella sp. CA-294648 TaxID=3239948 RepID=UPI003D9441E9
MSPPEAPAPLRAAVWLVLLTNVAWALVLPMIMVDPDTVATWMIVAAALAGHSTAHLLVMRAAVTPWGKGRRRILPAVGLVVATLVAWPILTTWAETDEQPWTWLVGFTISALFLVIRPLYAALVGVALTGLVVLAAMVSDLSVLRSLLFVAIAGLAAGVFAAIVVYSMRLLVAAETGRAAEASLAVAEERLRFSRELHDALGHRLNIIALKAELAGAEDLRQLAAEAAIDIRRAVHGYAALDMAEQVRGAELVLSSAGLDVEIAIDPAAWGQVEPEVEQLLATAVREGVTNILRHSDAHSCRIAFSEDGDLLRFQMTNDRPRSASAANGLGLSGLHDRAAALGARVRTEREDDRFVLCIEVPR